MQDGTTRKPTTAIAQQAVRGELTEAQVLEFVDQPLKQIPAPWRTTTWDFWSYWSHVLKNQLALAARLRHWREDGLTLEDVRAIFAKLTTPEATAKYQFAGELLAEVASLAAVRIAQRKTQREMAERRAETAMPDDAAKVRRMLGDMAQRLREE